MNVQEIRDLKTYYVDQFYNKVRAEQGIDDGFYKDVFDVPQLDLKVNRSRTGSGANIIDVPVEQLAASKLIASRIPLKDNLIQNESANRISRLLNDNWIDKIGRMGLVKEFFKNQFLRGEAWIHPVHNESWVTGEKKREGLPVYFLVPDPMIIFASPNEDENGVPEHVIVFYERSPWVVKSKYPAWENPKFAGEKNKKDTVTWIEYWDKDKRYFEADEQAVLKGGIQDNIYGFVPYIHKNAGFGKLYTPDGKMEDVIVGRLKRERDMLRRECAITSDVDYVIHTYANRSYDVQGDDLHPIPSDFRDRYEIGDGLMHELPSGIKVTRAEEALPERQLFEYLYSLKSEVGRVTPNALSGGSGAETGRLQDMLYSTAMRRWEGIVNNTRYAFATAFSQAFKIIEKLELEVDCGLKEGDINKNYEVKINLKSDDPIEEDRRATLGDRLWNQGNGCIDLRTNLISYQGKSQEEADDIIANILVDKFTLYNPDVASVMAMVFAEESGLAKWIDEAKQKQAMQAQSQQALQKTPPPTTQDRIQGEVKTGVGREMMDVALGGMGARKPPSGYTR